MIFPLTEIVPKAEFFDYEAKYNGLTEEITPARIDAELAKKCQSLASELYDQTQSSGIVRIDFILKGNVIYTALTDNGIVTLKKYNGEDLVFSGGTGGGSGSDSYWASGSTGAYSIISINDSGLDATANYAVAINHATLASGIYSFASGVDTMLLNNILATSISAVGVATSPG
mgnify:CR=1 FL=1